jgi:hypothetical protein
MVTFIPALQLTSVERGDHYRDGPFVAAGIAWIGL